MSRQFYAEMWEDVGLVLCAFAADVLELDDVILLLAFIVESEAEFLETYIPRSLFIPARFDIPETFTAYQFWVTFRFDRADLPRLITELRLRDLGIEPGVDSRIRVGIAGHTYVFSCEEALLVLLWRISHVERWIDGVPLFGRCIAALSLIVHRLLRHIVETFGHLLLLNPYFTQPHRLRAYADAVFLRGCPLGNCAFFLDATVRPIAMPTVGQQTMYCGKDHVHAIKYQNLIAPNGLIVHQHGPEEGRHHDMHILHASHVSALLEERARINVTPDNVMMVRSALPGCPFPVVHNPDGSSHHQYCCATDKGYHPSVNGAIIAMYFRVGGGPPLTPAQELFNAAISRVRVSVEWSFMETVNRFGYLDCKKQLKIYQTPVDHYYKTAAILTNISTILYGSRVGRYFNVGSPTLSEYLNLPPA